MLACFTYPSDCSSRALPKELKPRGGYSFVCSLLIVKIYRLLNSVI